MDKKLLAIALSQKGGGSSSPSNLTISTVGEGFVSNVKKVGSTLIIEKETEHEVWVGKEEEYKNLSEKDKEQYKMFITTDGESSGGDEGYDVLYVEELTGDGIKNLFAVTHSLKTSYPVVTVYNEELEEVMTGIKIIDENTVQIKTGCPLKADEKLTAVIRYR